MAAIVHMQMSLLLLSLLPRGVNGGGRLASDGRAHGVPAPCDGDLVCIRVWRRNASRTGESPTSTPKCTLQIRDPTAEDAARHRCRPRPGVFSQASPELKVTPGSSVSLQCVLLSLTEGRCYAPRRRVALAWVDEAGAEIQEDDPRHRIQRESPCDVTLTVTFQTPGDEAFRCRATAGERVHTSVGLQVRVPVLTGRGRGLIIEREPENQGGNRDAVGAAVGVAGCVVVGALVASLAVNRRRRRGTRSQPPGESCYATGTNNVVKADDDVVYADVIHPVEPGRAWAHVCESTEYACVRYA